MKNKKLLFSVTKDDFVIETFRSGGKGGQHQNKKDTGVRIKHPPSGAVGESRQERSQYQNKKIAFKRLVETKEFKNWIKFKSCEIMGGIAEIDRKIRETLTYENLKFECADKESKKYREIQFDRNDIENEIKNIFNELLI